MCDRLDAQYLLGGSPMQMQLRYPRHGRSIHLHGQNQARSGREAYPAAMLAYFGLAAASMLLHLIQCSFVILDLPLYQWNQRSLASLAKERRALHAFRD
jgi:hypothetical protein